MEFIERTATEARATQHLKASSQFAPVHGLEPRLILRPSPE